MPVLEWSGPPPFGGRAQIIFGGVRPSKREIEPNECAGYKPTNNAEEAIINRTDPAM